MKAGPDQGTCAMKRMLVRYKTKPEAADLNQRLIEAVFQELHAKAPDGVQYLALRLGDGSFVALRAGKNQYHPGARRVKAVRRRHQGALPGAAVADRGNDRRQLQNAARLG